MTDMLDNEAQEFLRAFDQRLIDLASARLEAGEPCYVSSLGISLGTDLGLSRSITGLGLVDYIRERLGSKFQVIRWKPNTDVVWWTDRPFVPPETGRSVTKPRRARVKPQIWAAFTDPQLGAKRFIDRKDAQIHVAETAAVGSWIPIEPDYIWDGSEQFSAAKVLEAINSWAEAHDVDLEILRDTPPPSAEMERSTAKAQPTKSRSLLEEIHDALDGRQVRSLSLPLDVALALSRARL